MNQEMKEFFENTFQFSSTFVENRRKLYQEGQRSDFTDVFLEKIHETTARGETGSSFYGELGCKRFINAFITAQSLNINIKWTTNSEQEIKGKDKVMINDKNFMDTLDCGHVRDA